MLTKWFYFIYIPDLSFLTNHKEHWHVAENFKKNIFYKQADSVIPKNRRDEPNRLNFFCQVSNQRICFSSIESE